MDAKDNPTIPSLADDPAARLAFERAVERAFRGWLNDVLGNIQSEPLSISEWSDLFDVDRTTGMLSIPRVTGAEKFGAKWRLPICKAPPKYWSSRGLLPGTDVTADCGDPAG